MPQKPTYFPHTTAQQRQLLFETWQATGNVTRACQTAHVTRRTFYNLTMLGYWTLDKPVSANRLY